MKIVFLDERVSDPARRETTFHYEGGIIDYVRYLNDGKTVLHDQPIYLEGQKDSVICRVAIQYTDGYTESLFSYVNNIPTGEGGTHETGFKAAFTKMFNDYARRNGFLKEKDSNLTGEDFREGLSCVLTTMVKNPQFEGQTKGRLGNSEVRPAVEGIITQQLTDWLENLKNQEIAQQIVQKAIRAAQVREAARKTRDNARKANQLDAAPLVGKLSACRGKKAEDNELFIVEGDSAGGSAKQGRDRMTQAILPLRGKILNTERASLDRMLKSDTIESLITAIGGGYGEDFDLDKVRYHKVIIMADADVDGAHIATLNLTLFFRYMRPMITAGYVYVAMPPLYRLKWTKGPHDFVYTDAERDRVLAEGKANGRQLPKGEGIQRYKGLGEMSYQELWETTMDPDHRILKQVHIEDALQADETFSMLMGDEVEPRRLFIQRNAHNARWIDA